MLEYRGYKSFGIAEVLTKYRNDNILFIGNKVCVFNILLDMQGFAHG